MFNKAFAHANALRQLAQRKSVRSAATSGLNRSVIHAATHSVEAAFVMLGASPRGLMPDIIVAARDLYGENVIESGGRDSVVRRIVRAFVNPFTLILVALAALSVATDVVFAAPGSQDPTTALLIVVMVLVSGCISFVQESRGSLAAASLKDMVSNTCCVRRRSVAGVSSELEIPMTDVVPGDIVRLAAGDMIPADLRIVEARDLFVNQAALTGESEPQEKYAAALVDEDGATPSLLALGDCANIAFAGTSVQSGSGLGVAVATGASTYLGGVAGELARGRQAPSAFDAGVAAVSRVLMAFMLVMCPVVFVVCGLTKGAWLDSLLFAVSIAVGITPQMLPVIVTTCLARGAATLRGEDVIVKELGAVQNLGAMDVLCCDKTGTLTQDKVVLERHLDALGREDVRVLRCAYLNSYFQTGLSNLIDQAIVVKLAELEDAKAVNAAWEKVDEIPFDFERRRLSVVVADRAGERQMVTKGAVEEILGCCEHVELAGEIVPLTSELAESVHERTRKLNEEGLRVIAVARKRMGAARDGAGAPGISATAASVVTAAEASSVPSAPATPVAPASTLSKDDEAGMTLVGYLAFLDPPKPSAASAVAELKRAGVGVKVLTGDSERVAASVCAKVGIDAANPLLGSEIDALGDVELARRADETDLMAKLSPLQKARVVRVLCDRGGRAVGFMGDGINDAAAMRAADVGISVDSAVDVAKESAGVILMRKDLTALACGIREGRRTHANMMKYIKLTTSSNFGNVLSVLVASVALPFLPMGALQLLFLGLVSDLALTPLPWDRVDATTLERPCSWNTRSVVGFMLRLGPVSSLVDVLTFALLWFAVCPAVAGGTWAELATASGRAAFAAAFQTGWFIESIWTQAAVVLMLRSEHPLRESPVRSLVFSLVVAAGALSLLPLLPAGAVVLDLASLPFWFYGALVPLLALYLFLTAISKRRFIRAYGELL